MKRPRYEVLARAAAALAAALGVPALVTLTLHRPHIEELAAAETRAANTV